MRPWRMIDISGTALRQDIVRREMRVRVVCVCERGMAVELERSCILCALGSNDIDFQHCLDLSFTECWKPFVISV